MGTDTGLLAHWLLAGDCRDRSGNGHHGRNQGADLAAAGAVFDGRGAHVLVPPSAALDLGTGDFTLAVQIHTDAVLDDVPGDIVTHDHELEPGWRRLAAVRRGGRLELHVDGSRVATSAAFDASAFDLSTDQPLRIGAGAIDTFNGRIRDLRLYRRALAEDEIGRLAS